MEKKKEGEHVGERTGCLSAVVFFFSRRFPLLKFIVAPKFLQSMKNFNFLFYAVLISFLTKCLESTASVYVDTIGKQERAWSKIKITMFEDFGN